MREMIIRPNVCQFSPCSYLHRVPSYVRYTANTGSMVAAVDHNFLLGSGDRNIVSAAEACGRVHLVKESISMAKYNEDLRNILGMASGA